MNHTCLYAGYVITCMDTFSFISVVFLLQVLPLPQPTLIAARTTNFI